MDDVPELICTTNVTYVVFKKVFFWDDESKLAAIRSGNKNLVCFSTRPRFSIGFYNQFCGAPLYSCLTLSCQGELILNYKNGFTQLNLLKLVFGLK